eukprot:s108_g10.t2
MIPAAALVHLDAGRRIAIARSSMGLSDRRQSAVSEVWDPNHERSEEELTDNSEAEPERAPEHREPARSKESLQGDLKVLKTRSNKSVAFEEPGTEPISLEDEVAVEDKVTRRDVIQAVQRCMDSLHPPDLQKPPRNSQPDLDGDRELAWNDDEAQVRAERLASQGEPKTPPVSPVSPRSPSPAGQLDYEEARIVEDDTLPVKALQRGLSQRSQSLPPRAVATRGREAGDKNAPSPRGREGRSLSRPPQREDASPQRAARPLSAWSVEDVVQWAQEVAGFPSEIAELLRAQAVNGLVLSSLTEQDLEVLGISKFGWRRQLTLLARTQEVKEPPPIFAPQAVRQLQPKPMVRPPGMPAQVIPAACPCQQRPMSHFVQPVLTAPPPPSFPQVPGKSLAFAPKSAPILPRQTLFARHASPPPGRLLVTRQTLPAQLPAWLMQTRALPSSPRRTAAPLRFASGQELCPRSPHDGVGPASPTKPAEPKAQQGFEANADPPGFAAGMAPLTQREP